MKDFKIYSINEWKESDNYVISEIFNKKLKQISNIIETNQQYSEYSIINTIHDNTVININVRYAYLTFTDGNTDYKLDIIIDVNVLDLFSNKEVENNDIVVDSFDYVLNDLNTGEKVNTTIKEDEFTDDFLIVLISELTKDSSTKSN